MSGSVTMAAPPPPPAVADTSASSGWKSDCLRIDVHTHILPENIPNFKEKFGYGGFIQLDHHKPCRCRMMKDDGTFFREIEDDCWSGERRTRDCDEHNLDVQVISTVPVMFSYWAQPQDCLEVCQFVNNHIAEVVASNPRRFVGLCTLPMQAPDLAVQELRRCITELGMVGVEIGSHINDWTLDTPDLFPIFEACQELNVCVFVHPWDMMGKTLMTKYWLPWLVSMPAETSLAICSMIFGGVFERLPNLRVLFAHAGGSFPATFGRIEHGFNVRPDLCAVDNTRPPRDYLGTFWVDSLAHDQTQLDAVCSLLGEDKVCLGTDYPFPLGEHMSGGKVPGELIDSMDHWTAERKAKTLGTNALEWMGVDADRFRATE